MKTIDKQLQLEADLKELDVVLDTIDEILAASGANGKTIRGCQLAVEEMFVNVANYAYGPEEPDPTCTLIFHTSYEEGKGEIRIEIRDHGKAFNPLAKEDPDITLSANERKIGGLGIYMTKTIMDSEEYCYKTPENVIVLTKTW